MKNSFSTSFLLFTGFLVIGYLVSFYFYPADHFSSASAASQTIANSYTPIQKLENGQRIILLIGVDSFNPATSHLQSLWLVSYLPSDPYIRLIPVITDGKVPINTITQPLNRSFNLSGSSGRIILDNKFTSYLQQNNYWWSGYILFDELVYEKISERLDSQVSSPESIYPEQNSLKGALSPAEEVSKQLKVLQSFCDKLMESEIDPNWAEIESLMPTHLLTDLDIQQFTSEWESTLSGGQGITCVFPTLSMTEASSNK